MAAMSSTWSFVVLRAVDNSVDVLGVGDPGAGAIVQNPRKLTVSGSGIVRPPKTHMSDFEYAAWLTRLQSQGFHVSEGPME